MNLANLSAVVVSLSLVSGCALFEAETSIGPVDSGTDGATCEGCLDGGVDTGSDAGRDADAMRLPDAEFDLGGEADMSTSDPLAGPTRTFHEIGLITESNAKFAEELNVLVHFERLVYDEDSLAVLPQQDTQYPDHDLYLVRTGGVEPLRSAEPGVIVFAPWAEDDLLMADESNIGNFATYSTVSFLAGNRLGRDGSFQVFVTGEETSWLTFPARHADGVETLADASTKSGASALTFAAAGTPDVAGGTFAGPRLGMYTAFRRDAEVQDSKPAFNVWTAQMWRYYTSQREELLDDSISSTRTAVLLHNGTPGIAAAVVETRLRRLGFGVALVEPDDLEADQLARADLIVLWPNLTADAGALIPDSVPIFSLAGDPDLLGQVGLFDSPTATTMALENRWNFAENEIVPESARGDEQVVVNDNEVTLALPGASVQSVPPTALGPDAQILASLTENGGTTAFVVDGSRRGGFVAMDLETLTRSQPVIGRLFDRVVLWLVSTD